MKVLVCGGRDFWDQSRVYATLSTLLVEHEIECVIHGNALGADTLAGMWATAHGIEQRIHYAEWKRLGGRAGPIRNAKMLAEEKPNLVVAFPGGSGTAHMVGIAKKAGVRVIEVSP